MPPQMAQQAAAARMQQIQTQAQARPGQPRSNPGQFGQRPQPGQVSAALKPMPPGLQFAQQPQAQQQQPGAPSAGMAHQLSQFHQSIRGKR